MKEDMSKMGIRTDRCMSASEIQIAAANYREVKRVAERKFDPNSKFDRFAFRLEIIMLILVGLYMAVVVIGALIA